MYRLHIYHSSTQRTAPQVHFLAVPQCSSRRIDGNTTAATYHNTVAVDYERILRLDGMMELSESELCLLFIDFIYTHVQFELLK